MGGIGRTRLPSFRGDARHRTTMCNRASENLEIPGSRYARPGMTKLKIQPLVAAEDAVLVEGDATRAREIGLDIRPRRDAVVQIDQAGNIALEGFHPGGEGVAQA